VGLRTRCCSTVRQGIRDTEQLAFFPLHARNFLTMRYRGGATSYLEVLTNETNYFVRSFGLAQAQLNESLGRVIIYRNLGGGCKNMSTTRTKSHGAGPSDCVRSLPNASSMQPSAR